MSSNTKLHVLHAVSVLLVLLALTGCKQSISGYDMQRAIDKCEGKVFSLTLESPDQDTLVCSDGRVRYL